MQLTLCPGEHTTAKLLLDLFYPGSTRVEHSVFSDIMPKLQAGQADFGLCIHEGRFTWQDEGRFTWQDEGRFTWQDEGRFTWQDEGRFTWQDEGLGLLEDLGTRWEEATPRPVPPD